MRDANVESKCLAGDLVGSGPARSATAPAAAAVEHVAVPIPCRRAEHEIVSRVAPSVWARSPARASQSHAQSATQRLSRSRTGARLPVRANPSTRKSRRAASRCYRWPGRSWSRLRCVLPLKWRDALGQLQPAGDPGLALALEKLSHNDRIVQDRVGPDSEPQGIRLQPPGNPLPPLSTQLASRPSSTRSCRPSLTTGSRPNVPFRKCVAG